MDKQETAQALSDTFGVAAGEAPSLTDDDLKELAYSAHEEAMSFGLSHETFLRYFKTIRNRTRGVTVDGGTSNG